MDIYVEVNIYRGADYFIQYIYWINDDCYYENNLYSLWKENLALWEKDRPWERLK